MPKFEFVSYSGKYPNLCSGVIKAEIALTEAGKKKCNAYIEELKAKRKEILDAGKDTADDTELPTIDDICSDIIAFEKDDEYYNNWGVTDHYNGDYPLELKQGVDYEWTK